MTTNVVRYAHFDEVGKEIVRLESEWVWNLLTRYRVDAEMLAKVRNDPQYPLTQWRDYLLLNYGLQIERDLGKKKCIISRISKKKGDVQVIGEWSSPEIVHVKQKGGGWYEIHPRCYSLI